MKRVGASVSFPHSSALAILLLILLCKGEVRIANETAALVSARVVRVVNILLILRPPILDSTSSVVVSSLILLLFDTANNRDDDARASLVKMVDDDDDDCIANFDGVENAVLLPTNSIEI